MIKILDFYADWCMPCKVLAPILQDIEEEFNYITLEKINIEEDPDTAEKYSIRNVPTLIFFKDNKQVDKIVGVVSRDKIKTMIAKYNNAA